MNSYYSQYKTEKESENPFDSVSCIVFNPYERNVHGALVASWDGFLRYYEFVTTGANKLLDKKWECYFEHPVLSCDITPQMLVIAGLATGEIVLVDMANSNNKVLLGSHDSPICRVAWC